MINIQCICCGSKLVLVQNFSNWFNFYFLLLCIHYHKSLERKNSNNIVWFYPERVQKESHFKLNCQNGQSRSVVHGQGQSYTVKVKVKVSY